MPTIVDGYNVILQSGLLRGRRAPDFLQRARNALIGLIASRMPNQMTTVVFDAAQAPPNREATYVDRGVHVRFAVDHDEADELIEELIRRESAPRKLTVVSSDHRIRKAAQRRGAVSVDALDWLDQLRNARISDRSSGPLPPANVATSERDTPVPLSPEQIEPWIEAFSLEPSEWDALFAEDTATTSLPENDSTKSTQVGNQPDSQLPFENPFPEGYGEDLIEGMGDDDVLDG